VAIVAKSQQLQDLSTEELEHRLVIRKFFYRNGRKKKALWAQMIREIHAELRRRGALK
jgi:hypothetical protein